MIELLLKSLYFFLPAYAANMAPVLVRRISWGRQPVWKRKCGGHKTWRGLITATLAGGIIFLLQKFAFYVGWQGWALIDYADFSPLFGFVMGGGAILGDLLKSYYKRKAEIKEGQPWVPFDQMDFVLGGLIASFFFYVPPVDVFFVIVILSPLLHILINLMGFWFGLRKEKF